MEEERDKASGLTRAVNRVVASLQGNDLCEGYDGPQRLAIAEKLLAVAEKHRALYGEPDAPGEATTRARAAARRIWYIAVGVRLARQLGVDGALEAVSRHAAAKRLRVSKRTQA